MNQNNELTISDFLLLTSNITLKPLIDDSLLLIKKLVHVDEVEFVAPPDHSYESRENVKVYNVARDGCLLGHMVLTLSENADVDDSHVYPVLALLANQMTLLNRCSHDLLTGLYNRQAMDERLREVFSHNDFSEQRRVSHQRVLVIIDIDHFKQVNDTYGHLYGDEILVLFAGILKDTFRKEDWIFRYGGDEFVVVMNDASLADSERVLERLKANVGAQTFPKVGTITMSIGFTEIVAKIGAGETFDRADHALYYVKEQGRDGLCSYEWLDQQGKGKSSEVDSDIELF